MSEANIQPTQGTTPPPGLFELLLAFVTISLSGFGGVLAWTRRMLVEERRWMTPEEFNDAYALCQFLPGPNVINLSVVFGRRIRGVPGALIALLGLVGPGFVIITIFAVLYAQFGSLAVLQRMFAGAAVAAAGLLISTTVKMAEPVLKDRRGLEPLIALATLAAIGIMHWPIYYALPVLIPISIAIAWWRRR